MTERRRSAGWFLLAAVLALMAAVLATAAVDQAEKEQETTRALPGTSTSEAPLPTTSSSPPSTTTTTIPEIEALIPLSVDAISEEVAPSVGFVLSQQGTGSGVVISEDLVVTNAHVAWPDRTVSLVFQNGATFQGRVLALDPFVDLAVIDISRLTRKPPPIELGSISDLEVGDELYVVGYPAPDEFTPEPTIDAGDILGFTDWEFTGVNWLTIEAPAIGGQSGGAVVDEYGRVVGISTFGSATSLTSIAIDDVLAEVDRLLAESSVRGLEPRLIPHSGARRSNDLELAGEWDQQLLFGWFPADSVVDVDWVGGRGELLATTIDGAPLIRGKDQIQFVPVFAFPVVVAVEPTAASDGSLESSLPLIAYEDPDHGRTLQRQGVTAGVFEVGGDRDFFYLDLEAGEEVSLTIESAARTLLRVYGPDGDLVVEDVDFSGFIGNDASVQLDAASAGQYIIAVESSLSTVSGYLVVTS